MIIDCFRQKLKCAHMHTVWKMCPNSGLNADSLGNSMILFKRKKDLRAFSYFDNTVCVYLSRNFHTVCVYLSRNLHTVCVHLSFIDTSRSIFDTIIHPNSGILYSPKALRLSGLVHCKLFLFHPPEEFMQRDWKFCRTSRTVDQQKQSGSVMLVHSEVKCTSSWK